MRDLIFSPAYSPSIALLIEVQANIHQDLRSGTKSAALHRDETTAMKERLVDDHKLNVASCD